MTGNQSGSRLTRRTFIRTSGSAGVTVYVLLSGPAWVGPRIALAADLVTLNSTQAKAMLAMARQLFPHDKLGDEYYWVVVESIEVADQGHVPLLEGDLVGRIVAFVETCEHAAPAKVGFRADLRT